MAILAFQKPDKVSQDVYKRQVVEVPASNLKKEITKILFEKGYILNYKFVEDGPQGTCLLYTSL